MKVVHGWFINGEQPSISTQTTEIEHRTQPSISTHHGEPNTKKPPHFEKVNICNMRYANTHFIAKVMPIMHFVHYEYLNTWLV
eukprot:8707126-Pyramimonas_sp.AAC.2